MGTTTPADLSRLLLRHDLAAFIGRTFRQLHPGATFHDSLHVHAIARALMRVHRGETKRLIITLPPRHLKSLSASVAFVAWGLGHDPTRRIITASYGADLAIDFSLQTRKIMETSWYKNAFPGTRLDPKRKTQSELHTTRNGFRLATSVDGTLTGKGGSLVIIDDPMKAGDAHSEAIRKKVKDWFTTTVLSRLDNPKDDAIVIVAQRLHIDDLIGYLLEQGGWELLILAAIATEDQRIPITDQHVWTRWKGDILQPERVGKAELAQLNKELGGANFEAQYQQNPAPPGGNFIKIEWFPRFDGADLNGYEMIIQSWDTAYGVEETNDYSVCTTWGLRADRIDLINVFRRQLAFPDLRKAVLRMHKQFKADIVIVEHAGSGVSLYQDLRAQGCGWIYTLSPDRDKVTRLAHQAAKIEQGLVALPTTASWLPPFEQEVAAFPYGKHDDQVDSMSQLLRALDYRTSPLRGLSIYRSPKWLWAAAQSSNGPH